MLITFASEYIYYCHQMIYSLQLHNNTTIYVNLTVYLVIIINLQKYLSTIKKVH